MKFPYLDLRQIGSTPLGKRNAEAIPPPPGLSLEESEAKARKTMMIHSVNIQQQVVLLQAVVQRFEVHELIHEVARFAVHGFDHQWTHHQVLQQVVERLSTEVKSCLAFAGRLTRSEVATAKQDANVSILRQKLEKTQSRFEKVSGLLEGIDTPVREVFAQLYEEKERIDQLTGRLVQLEDNGVNASDNDMYLALDAREPRVTSVVQAIWNDKDL
eukprot:2776762-Amphidinium_carterae.1